MKLDNEKPVDYTRAKLSALQELARGGDERALAELERRGIEMEPSIDLERLDRRELIALRNAWDDGSTTEERLENAKLALRAQGELWRRYLDGMRAYDGIHGPRPTKPAPPPWYHLVRRRRGGRSRYLGS